MYNKPLLCFSDILCNVYAVSIGHVAAVVVLEACIQLVPVESRMGHHLIWLRVFVAFLSLSIKFQGSNFIRSQQLLSESFSIYHSPIILHWPTPWNIVLLWETNSSSGSQEISPILWKLKIRYQVYKILLLVPILNQRTHSFLKSILILLYPLGPCLSRSLFPSGFRIKASIHLFPINVTYPAPSPH